MTGQVADIVAEVDDLGSMCDYNESAAVSARGYSRSTMLKWVQPLG
jgi:hypothetical protein